MKKTINPYTRIRSISSRYDNFLYLLFYTILWLSLTGLILFIFHKENRTLMWFVDGLYQHYPAFNHLCSYVESFFNKQPLSWFNLTLGQGADTLTTLNCYDFADPISIIAAAFIPLSRLARYELMLLIKLYLIGLSFYVFCRVAGKDNGIHIVAGALAYTFSGNILNMLTRHPNFINWAYFFPLMMAGAVRYRRKKKPGLFIASFFFNILTNYYTFYINVVLLIVYVLVYSVCTLISSREKGQFITIIKYCLNLIVYGFVGILLSMFTTLPTLYAYLSNTRVAQKTGYMASLFHYEPSFYFSFLANICSFNEVNYSSVTGMNAVAFTALPLLLITLYKKRTEPEFKLLSALYPSILIIMILFLSMPIAGRILNAFGYATNRWSYALFFFSGMALVELLSISPDIDRWSCLLSIIILALYVLISSFLISTDNSLTLMGLLTLDSLSILMIIAICMGHKYWDIIILFLTIIACSIQIVFLYVPSYRGFVLEHTNTDELRYRSSDTSFDAVKDDDTGFFRTSKSPLIPSQNQEILEKRHGLSLYWSIIPRWVFGYHNTFELPDLINPCNIGGLDSRTALMELASVKYFFKPDNIKAQIPFGYKKQANSTDEYIDGLYTNEYPLPIGYFFNSCISPEAYSIMSPPDKQQALLEGILLDNTPANIQKLDYTSNVIDLPYDITDIDRFELTDDLIKCMDKDGSITLKADIPSDCETYLWIDGTELYGDKGICTIYVSRSLNNEIFMKSSAPIHNQIYSWPIPRDGITYNLGYGGEGVNEINISFSDISSIGYKSIRLLAVPMNDYPEKVTRLKNSELKDINIEPDKITGRIEVVSDGFLQFSLPYTIGWTAYDNGMETELVRSDIMYMAIPLEAGEHYIELKYHIPYFLPGLCISLVTAVILILVFSYKLYSRSLSKKISS